MPAETIQQVEDGEVGAGPVRPVVVVESGLGAAGFVGAARVEPLQGRLLQGVGPPPQMGHPHHLLAPGDHRGQERVVGVDHVPHRGHRHRPEAGDLAHLSVDRIAPQPRPQVDPHDDLVRPRPAGRLPPRSTPRAGTARPTVSVRPPRLSDGWVPSCPGGLGRPMRSCDGLGPVDRCCAPGPGVGLVGPLGPNGGVGPIDGCCTPGPSMCGVGLLRRGRSVRFLAT